MAVDFSFELHDGSKCTVMYGKTTKPTDLLELLRSKFPNLTIQIVADDTLYNIEHLKWTIRQSWFAKDRGVMLAKRVELDLLMRIAGASQISEAIKIAGAKENIPFYIACIGAESRLQELAGFLKEKCELMEFRKDGNKKVLQRFGINQGEIDVVGKWKIAPLLAEKGLLAVAEKI